MRNITVFRRYLFQLYPHPDQAEALHQQRQMVVDLWNALLQRHEDIRRRTRGQKGVAHTDDAGQWTLTRVDNLLSEEIKILRAECTEWLALSVWTAHETRRALKLAFEAFFRRAKQGAGAQSGYPRYQRRRDGARIPHRHNLPLGKKSGSGSGCRLSHRDRRNWQLALKGVNGEIHARGMLPTEALAFSAADVIWRDGKWWLSICTEMEPRRAPGRDKVVVDFDLIDGLARVDGYLETPDKLNRAALLAAQIDELKSERDQRWPRRIPTDPEWQDAQTEISRLSAHEARLRRECLHVWSSRITRRAADLTIRVPQIKEQTASPRGDQKQWGANVETVSHLNRNTLSYAPAMAVAMLQYKAEEAGIRCDVITDEAPAIAIGSALVQAGRKLRRAARATKRSTDVNSTRSGSSGHQGRGGTA